MALSEDGVVWEWGSPGESAHNAPVAVSLPGNPTIRKIVASGSTGLAIPDDGVLFGWGSSVSGALGFEQLGNVSPQRLDFGGPVDDVWAGGSSTVVRLQDGRLLGAGSNDAGQLGVGELGAQFTPVQIGLPADVDVADIAINSSESHAVTTDGRWFRWGAATGLSSTPVLAPDDFLGGEVRIAQITSGGTYAGTVLGDDGVVYRWGLSGKASQFAAPRHLKVSSVSQARALTTDFTLALNAYGLAYAIGANGSKQLGTGETTGKTSTFASVIMPTRPDDSAFSRE